MKTKAAIILAAGNSSRLGRPKQLLQYKGSSLVQRAVKQAGEAGCDPIIVVVGACAGEVIADLKGTQAILCYNPRWESGMGSSIKAGLRVLEDRKVEGTLLMVCDQIHVDALYLKKIMERGALEKVPAVASIYEKSRGVPAWFHHALFPELKLLQDSTGAKSLLNWLDKLCASEPFPLGAVDIDTPQDVLHLQDAA